MHRPGALLGIAALSLAALLTALGPGGKNPATDDAAERWDFTLRSSTFSGNATLRHVSNGKAIGPDLKPHPARIFHLSETLVIQNVTYRLSWEIAISEYSARVLSIYTDCASFKVRTNNSSECENVEELRIPVSEEFLFFGAPLVLRYLPTRPGNFTIPLWAGGAPIELPFASQRIGDTILVAALGRYVEQGYLESPGTSFGDVLDCNVFEGDALLIRPDAIGCRESFKGWQWWTTRKHLEEVPIGLPSFFTPPLKSRSAPHLIPDGTDVMAFPIGDAIDVARRSLDEFVQVTQDSSWKFAKVRYSSYDQPAGLQKACSEFHWVLVPITRDSSFSYVEVIRNRCSGDASSTSDEDEARRLAPEEGLSWPIDNRMVDLQEVERLVRSKLLCVEFISQTMEYDLFTRDSSVGSRTWLVAGYSLTNSVTVEGATGFVFNLQRNPGHGLLGELFREGIPRTCQQSS